MKAKSYLLAFTLMLAGALLVGCTKTTQATTTKNVDPTSQSTTKPTQGTTQPTQAPTQAPTQPTQKVKVDLAKPVITVNQDGTGVTVAAVEHATKLQVSVDEGQFEDLQANAVIPFDTAKGQHSVVVKAVGNDDYNDMRSDAFAYETKDAEVTIIRTNRTTVTLAKEGMGLKIDGTASTETSFTVTASGTHKFQAVGGFDAEHKIFYNNSKEQEVVFALDAESTKTLVNAGTVESNADAAELFTIKKYGSNGWEASTATATKSSISFNNQNTPVISLNHWDNQVAFGYIIKDQPIVDAYKGIIISIIGNDYSNVTLQFVNSKTGVYAQYDLGIIDSNAFGANIPFSDAGWKVFYGKDSINGFEQALSLVHLNSVEEVYAYFDLFGIVLKGNNNNQSAKVYLGGLYLSAEANFTAQKQYFINQPASRLLGTDASGVNYDINVGNTGEGTITTLNLMKVNSQATAELSKEFTFEEIQDQTTKELFINVTSKEQSNNVPIFTLKLKILQMGQALKAVEATGIAAGLLNKVFSPFNPTSFTLDFQDGTTGNKYNNENWESKQFTTAWVATTDQMNCREKDGSKVVNVTAGGNAQQFIYTVPEADRGMVDTFTAKFGNYFDPKKTINIKVKLVATDGTEVFVIGSANAWYGFQVTTGMNEVAVALSKPIIIKQIIITTQLAGASGYVYMDDLHVEFLGYAIKAKDLNPLPPVEELVMDFESAEVGALADEKWARQKYTTKWESITGGINIVEADGNKSANFTGGWSTTFMYTYTNDAKVQNINHIEFDYANVYKSTLAKLQIKVKVVLENGAEVYLIGSSSAMQDVEYGTVQHFSLDVEQAVNVKNIVVVVKCSSSEANYLTIDNLKLQHKEAAQA